MKDWQGFLPSVSIQPRSLKTVTVSFSPLICPSLTLPARKGQWRFRHEMHPVLGCIICPSLTLPARKE